MHDLNLHAPKIKYVQDDENTFCLSSLDITLFDTR